MALSAELRVPIGREAGLPYIADPAAADDAPAIRALNDILDAALTSRASDIHLEPLSGAGRVRQRVDGLLRESRRIDGSLFARIVSRVKLLAGMDIADRRVPQDGRFGLDRAGRNIDARVSSIQTVFGESLAIRLLDGDAGVPSLDRIGMPERMLERYRDLVGARSGFIIVCGPTGSGKTTTLYASLQERNSETQRLCTIEDPVEMQIHGVAQTQVNVRAGLSFTVALRSILRQDPDAIMIGEMRDPETAATSVAAAVSGQLVLTTLHSSDAILAVERLVELGIPVRGIAAAVTAILSQRLLRQLCPDCKHSQAAGPAGRRLGIDPDSAVFAPVGCERCDGTGYRGRNAAFELAAISDDLRQAIVDGAQPVQLRAAARVAGYESLLVGAVGLVSCGATSVAEALRAVGARA